MLDKYIEKEGKNNMELIEELLKKMNSNNSNIIMSLSNIITSKKIKTLEELFEYETKKFMVDGKEIPKEEQVQYCIQILDSFPYDYEELDYDEIQVYKKNRKVIDDSISSINEKILSIIIIFNLTHRELYFPYEAYNFIIDSKI